MPPYRLPWSLLMCCLFFSCRLGTFPKVVTDLFHLRNAVFCVCMEIFHHISILYVAGRWKQGDFARAEGCFGSDSERTEKRRKEMEWLSPAVSKWPMWVGEWTDRAEAVHLQGIVNVTCSYWIMQTINCIASNIIVIMSRIIHCSAALLTFSSIPIETHFSYLDVSQSSHQPMIERGKLVTIPSRHAELCWGPFTGNSSLFCLRSLIIPQNPLHGMNIVQAVRRTLLHWWKRKKWEHLRNSQNAPPWKGRTSPPSGIKRILFLLTLCSCPV